MVPCSESAAAVFFAAILLQLALTPRCSSAAAASLTCPDGIFSFGDSFADTGNYAAAFPDPPPPISLKSFSHSAVSFASTIPQQRRSSFNYLNNPRNNHVQLPGSSEFESSKARLPFRSGNGRLVIDFVAQAFGKPFLAPYFQNVQPNFTHGANFAFASSTARNTSITVPFFLFRQVNHYYYFKGNVYNSHGAPLTPPFSLFSTAIHWISIGVNDFWQNYYVNNLSISDVKNRVVPEIVFAISEAVQRLFAFGARTFMVVNIPAAGCLPTFLSLFGTGNPDDYDSLGCLKNHNDAAHTYSSLLESTLKSLRQQLPDAYIMYGDYYQAHLDAVTNPSKYGLSSTATLSACCGDAGKLHAQVLPCTDSTPVCADPDSYISWDGLHFTESFNRVVALNFLRGDYVEPWPSSNLTATCRLDFSKFF